MRLHNLNIYEQRPFFLISGNKTSKEGNCFERQLLTFNVPLTLKIWDIIYLFMGKLVYGLFLGIF